MKRISIMLALLALAACSSGPTPPRSPDDGLTHYPINTTAPSEVTNPGVAQ